MRVFKKILFNKLSLGALIGAGAVFGAYALFSKQTFHFMKSDIKSLLKIGG